MVYRKDNGEKIACDRPLFEQVWLDDEHTRCTHKEVGKRHYEVELVNEEIIKVTRDDECKTVLVREDSEFVWSLKKTYIRARYKAKGVYEHLESCFGKDGMMWNSADFFTFCDFVVDEMKPAPKRPELGMNHERLMDAAKYATTCGGCFVDVGDGWKVAIDTRYGMRNAYLRNFEARIDYEFEGDRRMTPTQFAKVAADELWNEFAKDNRKAA